MTNQGKQGALTLCPTTNGPGHILTNTKFRELSTVTLCPSDNLTLVQGIVTRDMMSTLVTCPVTVQPFVKQNADILSHVNWVHLDVFGLGYIGWTKCHSGPCACKKNPAGFTGSSWSVRHCAQQPLFTYTDESILGVGGR
jgi:hypothetical protein